MTNVNRAISVPGHTFLIYYSSNVSCPKHMYRKYSTFQMIHKPLVMHTDTDKCDKRTWMRWVSGGVSGEGGSKHRLSLGSGVK